MPKLDVSSIMHLLFRSSKRAIVLIAFLGAALSVCISLAHFVDPESTRLLGALSFIQPIYILVFALPSLAILLLFRHFRWSLGFSSIVLLNIIWNEDYRVLTSFSPNETEATGLNLRLTAWNVQGLFFGIPKVVDALHRSESDVLLLSELTLKAEDQADFQKRMAPYQTVLSQQGDVAILSRLPIVDSNEVELPTHQPSLTRHNFIENQTKNKKRSFLHCVVQVGQEQVNVLSIRFLAGRAPSEGLWDNIKWGLYLWQQQEKEVQFFRDYIRQLKGPYVFGGDLNAVPASRTIKLLNTIGSDSYMAHNNWGQFTFKTKILPSSKDKNLPVMRLDYIFASWDLTSISARRVAEVQSSDHFPIQAVINIPQKTRGTQYPSTSFEVKQAESGIQSAQRVSHND